MKTTFWLVRHGPTNLTAANGWTDVPADLSDLEQVARTSSVIPDDATVVSSDLIRAVDTASAIGGDRVRLDHDIRLREFHFGEWEGREFDEIAAADPVASRAFWENPGDVAPPGGESFNAVQKRVSEALGSLAQAHQNAHVCCVAHFGVILAAVANASQMPASAAIRFQVDNLSVSRLEYFHGSNSWSVKTVNHLP